MSIVEDLLKMFPPDKQQDQPVYETLSAPVSPKLEEFTEDVAACQKLNLSGLQANSNGNGWKRNTVYHAIVLHSLERGRLKRNRYDFLCGASKKRSFGYDGRAESVISCPKCKDLVERHRLSVCTDGRINELISCY